MMDFSLNSRTQLTDEQKTLLTAVAEEQKKRYIDKCPCCGHDNMYTHNGKTFPSLSNRAAIYICSSCIGNEHVGEQALKDCAKLAEERPEIPEEEFEKIIHQFLLPLQQWAVFKPNCTDTFLQKEEQPAHNLKDMGVVPI